MSVGLQDLVCPARITFAVFNIIQTNKEYHVYPFAKHWVSNKHKEIKNKWMAKMPGIEKLGD